MIARRHPLAALLSVPLWTMLLAASVSAGCAGTPATRPPAAAHGTPQGLVPPGPRPANEGAALQPIGVVHTPYTDNAPYQPVPDAPGSFRLVVAPKYADGLKKLESFRYIYVLFLMDRVRGEPKMVIHPPWAPEGTRVGVFASRSPRRPSPIGLSIVRVLKVQGNVVTTSGLDAFDGSPLLDIKPYLSPLDTRCDANAGWVDELPDDEHLRLHLQGIPHDDAPPATAQPPAHTPTHAD